MIGQESVLRAIVNALDTNRLHHAYLFTGMRGVGKTTIARIFAKCLNCEANGVSANPCGECSTCQDIENGRFFDLIEVDAASRTKVEETRELLENVPYAPSSGRYKVYLIDEVHMFSNHSFNALLKTLEEPPEHVKFLLATTDPQKVPVTVLSRCLQFNLKRMSPSVLADYLSRILGEESIECERPALDLIARASEGSVRDSLSLVEQAAAFGEGAVREADVESMLGRASMDRLLGLIESLGHGDLKQLFSRVDALAEYAPDFAELLGELLSLFHKIAMLQNLPRKEASENQDQDRIATLAETLDADEIQLFYQIGMHARRDMPFAPDPREAFDMALLRMNSFRPQGPASQIYDAASAVQKNAEDPLVNKSDSNQNPMTNSEAPATDVAGDPSSEAPSLAVRGEVSAGGSLRAAALAAALGDPDTNFKGADQARSRPESSQQTTPKVLSTLSKKNSEAKENKQPVSKTPTFMTPAAAPVESTGGVNEVAGKMSAPSTALQREPGWDLKPDSVPSEALDSESTTSLAAPAPPPIDKSAFNSSDWPQIIEELDISGMPKQLANHMELASFDGVKLHLKLEADSEHLNTSRFASRLNNAFNDWIGKDIRLSVELVEAELVTPARLAAQIQADEMAAARRSIDQDPVVRQLIDRVDASVDQASIQPVGAH